MAEFVLDIRSGIGYVRFQSCPRRIWGWSLEPFIPSSPQAAACGIGTERQGVVTVARGVHHPPVRRSKHMAKPIPDGFHTITPHLVITGAAQAVEWYQKAFSAELLNSMPMPDGKLMHAELRIGNSMLMLADCFPEMGQKSPKELGTSTVVISLYVPDCDKVWNQALAAG